MERSAQSLPLYVQIAEIFIRDIAAGRYVDGARLTPERELARTLGTTVTTLRKALRLLEEKGLLDRLQGSGNYIRTGGDVDSVYSFFRVELKGGGGLPTAQTLSVERCLKPADLPQFGHSDEGFRIRRLRSLDGLPCLLEEIWLDGSYSKTLQKEQLSESLYLFYRQSLDLWITRAEDRLVLRACPDWAPDEFIPEKGSPCVCVDRISWGQDDTRAEVSRNWIDSSRAHYVARIK